jgi:hypothetical protein
MFVFVIDKFKQVNLNRLVYISSSNIKGVAKGALKLK